MIPATPSSRFFARACAGSLPLPLSATPLPFSHPVSSQSASSSPTLSPSPALFPSPSLRQARRWRSASAGRSPSTSRLAGPPPLRISALLWPPAAVHPDVTCGHRRSHAVTTFDDAGTQIMSPLPPRSGTLVSKRVRGVNPNHGSV